MAGMVRRTWRAGDYLSLSGRLGARVIEDAIGIALIETVVDGHSIQLETDGTVCWNLGKSPQEPIAFVQGITMALPPRCLHCDSSIRDRRVSTCPRCGRLWNDGTCGMSEGQCAVIESMMHGHWTQTMSFDDTEHELDGLIT